MKTKIAALLSLCAILLCAAVATESPDWAHRKFAAPADKVYKLAVASIERQQHRIVSQDEHARVVKFHVGGSMMSRGYDMVLTVTPDGQNSAVTTDIDRTGGKAVSWGSGRKEVEKIYRWIDEQLASPSSAPK